MWIYMDPSELPICIYRWNPSIPGTDRNGYAPVGHDIYEFNGRWGASVITRRHSDGRTSYNVYRITDIHSRVDSTGVVTFPQYTLVTSPTIPILNSRTELHRELNRIRGE